MSRNALEIVNEHSGIDEAYKELRAKKLPKVKELYDWYKGFGMRSFQHSLYIVAPNYVSRVQAKKYAIAMMLSLVEVGVLSPPVYYIKKGRFVEYWRKYLYGFEKYDTASYSKGDMYLKANLIIFDGIDEIYDKKEKQYIMHFIESAMDNNIPFIFIGTQAPTDDFMVETNAYSLFTRIREFSKLVNIMRGNIE